MHRRIVILAILLFSFSQSTVFAQCKGLANDKCSPRLGDFLPNGRLYQSVLEKGSTGELYMVLNGGQQYRIITCADDKLGATEWQLLDSRGNVVFDNREHNMAQAWDITVASTQEFTMRIQTGTKKGVGRGCSCILVGYKRSALDQLAN